MNGNILVIGSLNMDQSINVEAIPVIGETVIGRNLTFSPGGKGANQACACGKLGGNTLMLGCVGNDDFGKQQILDLSRSGVDMSRIKVSNTSSTGSAIIYVDRDGDNCIVIAAGANEECNIDYIRENDQCLQDSEYILLQMEIPYDVVQYIVKRGCELGKKIILNPAPAPNEMPKDIYEYLMYITPNETELSKLTGMDCNSPEQIKAAARVLLNKGVKNVLVTIGKNGVILVNTNSATLYPTTDIKSVDTTAAGDTFNAAFLVGLAEGKTTEESIRFGNMASSLTVTRKGAQNSIPTRQETEKRIVNFHPVPIPL